MKKLQTFVLSFLILSLIVCSASIPVLADEPAWPQAPEISADGAIVIEASSGAMLYEKNIHNKYYPASITKIMTTLLALENCSLSETVTFSQDSVNKVEGTQVGITPGEQLSLEQCLYGIMLGSANEISYAVAEHVGNGNLQTFVDMMNEKAADLGCQDTHFSNPHGLPDENHYTTAYDMSLIARAAYANELFRTITGTKYYVIPPTNLYGEERGVGNHHKMLTNTSFHYDYCTGGKTGFTSAARNTLVTFAEKDGMTLICVIMHDDATYSQYYDTTTLFNYCFQNFTKVNLTESDLGITLDSSSLFPLNNAPFSMDDSHISMDSSACLVLPNNMSVHDLTSSVSYEHATEQEIAQIEYRFDEHLTGCIPILYEAPAKEDSSMLKNTDKPATAPVSQTSFIKINLKKILITVGAIVLAAIVILIVIRIILNHNYTSSNRKAKNRKRRKKKSNDFRL